MSKIHQDSWKNCFRRILLEFLEAAGHETWYLLPDSLGYTLYTSVQHMFSLWQAFSKDAR